MVNRKRGRNEVKHSRRVKETLTWRLPITSACQSTSRSVDIAAAAAAVKGRCARYTLSSGCARPRYTSGGGGGGGGERMLPERNSLTFRPSARVHPPARNVQGLLSPSNDIVIISSEFLTPPISVINEEKEERRIVNFLFFNSSAYLWEINFNNYHHLFLRNTVNVQLYGRRCVNWYDYYINALT